MLRRFAVFFVTFGLVSSACAANASSSLQGENLFPPGPLHCHASCVVELADGDLLACWFYGSGERTADDVRVEGARLKRGAKAWGPRFTMADTPNHPDCNPAMFLDGRGRLWLVWVAILANTWESALLKYRIASDPRGDGAPRWDSEGVIHLQPQDGFAAAARLFWDGVERDLPRLVPDETERRKVATAMGSLGLVSAISWRSVWAGCRGRILRCCPVAASCCLCTRTASIFPSWRGATTRVLVGKPPRRWWASATCSQVWRAVETGRWWR
jgi:hypothetical protein